VGPRAGLEVLEEHPPSPRPIIQSLYWQTSPHSNLDLYCVYRFPEVRFGNKVFSQVTKWFNSLNPLCIISLSAVPNLILVSPRFYSGLSQCPYTVWHTGSPILSSYVDSTVAFLFQNLPLSLSLPVSLLRAQSSHSGGSDSHEYGNIP